ncbi:MAG: 16S rRNA (guanine(527)-N(7))-methyltransferase RsmG [Rhodobacteraceae bacterium]|nr:MAG: 16S rRNA (guanine(527)-N(7))-methyltransferase RsmG [Paracoccaceae bacterium]
MTGYEPDVSRETMDKLVLFHDLLVKWNARINLVSRSSLNDFWVRHVADSVQVFRLAPSARTWADLGSGGGFPGLIVAILAKSERPKLKVTLIESDQRKSAFLRTVIRETGVSCNVIAERIEKAEKQGADIVSARALANLTELLTYSDRHLATGGTALFPKGVTWQKELEMARTQWSFDVEVIESQTMPGAAILKIEGVSRV